MTIARPDSDIEFQDTTLSVLVGGRRVRTLDNASLVVPRARLALIGESRVATVSVIDVLVRRLIPQRGQLTFRGRVSWPIGHPAPFTAVVTGKQVVSHFSILYRFDRKIALEFLYKEFSAPELLHRPIETWPRLKQTQFMLLMALIPDFEVYVVDANLVMLESPEFASRFLSLFHNRTRGRTVLMTARQHRFLKVFCTAAVTIAGGRLSLVESIDEALKISDSITVTPGIQTTEDSGMDQDDLLF